MAAPWSYATNAARTRNEGDAARTRGSNEARSPVEAHRAVDQSAEKCGGVQTSHIHIDAQRRSSTVCRHRDRAGENARITLCMRTKQGRTLFRPTKEQNSALPKSGRTAMPSRSADVGRWCSHRRHRQWACGSPATHTVRNRGFVRLCTTSGRWNASHRGRGAPAATQRGIRASRAGQSTASMPGRRTVEHLPPSQRWRQPATRSEKAVLPELDFSKKNFSENKNQNFRIIPASKFQFK